jgi:signal transduction histidine kinase
VSDSFADLTDAAGRRPPSGTSATDVRVGVRVRPSAPLSLAALAPFVVVLLGVVVALAIGTLGSRQMRRAAEDDARARVELLADALVARISPLSPEGRAEALRVAVRRTAAEGVLADDAGNVSVDATLGSVERADVASWIARGTGEAHTRIGAGYFVARRVRAGPWLVLVMRKPPALEGEAHLGESLVALTTLLVFAAAAVAFSVTRDAGRDIDYVTRRIEGMVQVRSEPTGELVPVRAIDEIGGLAVAFNRLVVRFVEAERDYHGHLSRARAADKDRAAFLAAVSHELRSPLNAILGFSDILVQEVDGPLSPEAREEVEQIRGSGHHLLGLINDILEFSAIESGQLKLAVSAVDVLHVATDVVREAKLTVGKRPVVLEVAGDGPIFAHVDPRRLRQVIGNLVGNAVKFTERGTVTVTCVADGREVSIEVADTGKGIAPEEQSLVFEDYKQVGEERGRKRGTGLGLAIARRLVLAHGGTIRLESELGKGTTFFVTLPRVTQESSPPDGPESVKRVEARRAAERARTSEPPPSGGPPSSRARPSEPPKSTRKPRGGTS